MLSKISFAVIICCGLVQAFPQGSSDTTPLPPVVSCPVFSLEVSFSAMDCKAGQVWDRFEKTCKSGVDFSSFSLENAFQYDEEETTTER